MRKQNDTKQSNKVLNLKSNETTLSAKRKLLQTDEETIALPISTTGQSHSRCFICGKPGPKLVRIKKEARHDIFIELNIILSKGARCCPKHLTENSFCKEAFMLLKNNKNIRNVSHFTCEEVHTLIENIRKAAKDNRNKRVDFDDNGMNDNDYESLTGLNRAQFDDLLTYIKNSKKSQNRSIRGSLGVFLTKLRTGLSNRILGTIFNMTKSQVRRSFASIRKQLSK
jgi:hypothetical protein